MSILNLAKKINYPPSMVARAIVEHVASFDAALNRRKVITEAIRDPIRILSSPTIIAEAYRGSERVLNTKAEELTVRDPFSGQYIFHSEHNQITRLAREVMEATQADPLYGPRFDKERNFVGVEYEIILEQTLRAMGIPFETEDQLRIRGTARTPDILFPCPVAIQIPQMTDMKSTSKPEDQHLELRPQKERNDQGHIWKMVCWIDSKALFGDVATHQTSVLPQAEAYVHRFGPGLVLYWFGHAPIERLGDGHGDVLVIGWNVPQVFMLPTGEVIFSKQYLNNNVKP